MLSAAAYMPVAVLYCPASFASSARLPNALLPEAVVLDSSAPQPTPDAREPDLEAHLGNGVLSAREQPPCALETRGGAELIRCDAEQPLDTRMKWNEKRRRRAQRRSRMRRRYQRG